MKTRTELMRDVLAIDAEARQIERQRCVRIVREAALLAATDELAEAFKRLADKLEAPDA